MTLKERTESFIDAPIQVGEIPLPHPNWLLCKLGIKKKQPLIIYPLPIGKVQMIGVELCEMLGSKELKGKDHTEQINYLLASNIPRVIRIVSLASCESKQIPSPKLIEAIGNTLTTKEIHTAFYEVYRRLDLTTFFDIMALSKNLQISLIPDQEAHGQP